MEKVIAEVFERYPQIGLPIVAGSRQSEAFRAAVYAGEPIRIPAENIIGDERDSFTAALTPAGACEILHLYRRCDFENAVRCLAKYCEPVDLPASMGAITIGGLINRKKINDHVREYLANGGTDPDEEMRRFTSVPENYRDYLIILSSGGYSGITAGDAGVRAGRVLSDEDWRALSVTIRKYHELTHFIARKLFPENKEAIRDEIVADAVGLIAAFGRYDAGLAELFLGLESETYREGGRLQNYYGTEEPAAVQARARGTIASLAAFLEGAHITEQEDVFRLAVRIEEEKAGMI